VTPVPDLSDLPKLPDGARLEGVWKKESTPSRYTGKPVREMELKFRVQGEADQQSALEALEAASEDGPYFLDPDGGQWEVEGRSYSFQESSGLTTYHHVVDLKERQELNLTAVEIDDLTLVPERWKFDQHGEDGFSVGLLFTLLPDALSRFEELLENANNASDVTYFPVSLVGIMGESRDMRFGQCLWQKDASGGARYALTLVSEIGDDEADGQVDFVTRLIEPRSTRLVQQSVSLGAKLDALIEELHKSGALSDEAVARIENAEGTRASRREFERVGDVEAFFG
jgi:hypothetical protein